MGMFKDLWNKYFGPIYMSDWERDRMDELNTSWDKANAELVVSGEDNDMSGDTRLDSLLNTSGYVTVSGGIMWPQEQSKLVEDTLTPEQRKRRQEMDRENNQKRHIVSG